MNKYSDRDIGMVAAGVQIAAIYICSTLGLFIVPDDVRIQLAGIIQHSLNGGEPLGDEAMQIAQTVLGNMQDVTQKAIHSEKFTKEPT